MTKAARSDARNVRPLSLLDREDTAFTHSLSPAELADAMTM